jgi:hypothetical protein
MEAWIQRRDLPFVMIVPQAPYPDGRANTSVSPPGFVEKRDTSAAPPPRPEPFADAAPIPEDGGPLRERSSGTPVNPWLRMEKKLVALVENTARGRLLCVAAGAVAAGRGTIERSAVTGESGAVTLRAGLGVGLSVRWTADDGGVQECALRRQGPPIVAYRGFRPSQYVSSRG